MLSKYAAALALLQTAVEGLRLVVKLLNIEGQVSKEDLNAARASGSRTSAAGRR